MPTFQLSVDASDELLHPRKETEKPQLTNSCGGKVAERRLLVPAAGVEPATFRSGGERSNPLSYAG
jgi:hypothetical protein